MTSGHTPRCPKRNAYPCKEAWSCSSRKWGAGSIRMQRAKDDWKGCLWSWWPKQTKVYSHRTQGHPPGEEQFEGRWTTLSLIPNFLLLGKPLERFCTVLSMVFPLMLVIPLNLNKVCRLKQVYLSIAKPWRKGIPV